jgi:hypothetical protein
MPIFFKRKNERSSTFVHLALWRQQLFMHINMHDDFSDAQCGAPDTAHQAGAPTHQKGGYLHFVAVHIQVHKMGDYKVTLS